MKKRQLGNTGIHVSEIGFGAWQLGNAKDWGSMSEKEAIHLVHQAMDGGCNFFDTAPNYGQGQSERLLGEAFKGRRDQVVINTKFGHTAEAGDTFSRAGLKASLERSLHQLKTDYVDSILIHNPPFELLNGNKTDLYDELEKLKQEGKIRAYGASVDSSRDMLEVMRTTNSQVLEVLFNIFHQETSQAFAEAQERRVGLIAKVPLDSGWLSGKYTAESQFEGIRSRWTQDTIKRRFELLQKLDFVKEDGLGMIHAALRFILSFDTISTVIPGIKNSEQLKENFSASEAPLEESLKNQLVAFWERELKAAAVPW